MIEQKPKFEDDKIRAWTFGPEDRQPKEYEGDPTVMYLDVEREEIFESRTYRFQDSPDVLGFLIEVAASQLSEVGASPEEIISFAIQLMEDTAFKFLAKRSTENGLIDAMLVAVGGDHRCILVRQEQVGEEEYRQAVQEFETSYLPEGVLTDPLVVALEEWRRYSREMPFCEIN